MPVEVPRKKALASSIERSELLTSGFINYRELLTLLVRPFTGGRAFDAFGASLDAC